MAFMFILAACVEKENLPWNRVTEDETEEFSHDMIVLGEKLDDPYSVSNMTKALENVSPAAASGRGSLQATDFYVRFLPRDEAQFQELMDLGLKMLDHPLDYRIIRDGDWYHDPSISEESFTWQYAVVPVNFEFPRDIRYERLEDCYLTEHDPATKADGIDWLAVEEEAYRLTGNSDLFRPGTRAGGATNPEGYITIMDPDHSPEPIGVKGVEVCCNSFVKIATGYTDEKGHYKLNRTYSSDVHYRLVFRNVKGFRQGLNRVLIPASVSTLGKQGPEGCTVTLDSSSEPFLFTRCVVNNAGYDYLLAAEKSGNSIPPPPRNMQIWDIPILDFTFNVMMHQGVILETFEPLHTVLGVYTIIAKTVQADAYIGMGGFSSYNDVYKRALLVFAHGGHFSRVGKEWWQHYVLSSLGSLVGTLATDLIGITLPEEMAYVKLANMYASYCQAVLYRRNYPDSPDSFFSSSDYSPQLLLFLDERGLGLEQIAPLFTTEVADIDMLKLKMLSYYPEFKTVINEAFARYGEQYKDDDK